ncbi:MAG: hypothetical protein NT167_21505, partial [Verrucomicrobia bacterium]|nr:hypothetical protein [Verrucomicrobiota bacterium]
MALAVTATATLRSEPQITAAQLASLTPVALTNCLSPGNYYFLHGPDPEQPWPPLPAAPLDVPGDTPVYDLGGGYLLIDDSAVDWHAIWQAQEVDAALTSLEVQYGIRTNVQPGATFSPTPQTAYTTDALWLELTRVTNYTANLIVHSPEAEATSGVYDLYLTTSLSPEGQGLNLTNWLWLLRTDPGQTNLTVPDLLVDGAFFMLGRTNDTDGDGMSDAYEV